MLGELLLVYRCHVVYFLDTGRKDHGHRVLRLVQENCRREPIGATLGEEDKSHGDETLDIWGHKIPWGASCSVGHTCWEENSGDDTEEGR